ncbi:vWA domain-containing protein [Hydrocarboniphaga sp.]|uniref:vWA domain-containing protein n=1 Tax=Hydrocarboniphaga sp. TaxID=2033016 RepID=UPI003D1295F4
MSLSPNLSSRAGLLLASLLLSALTACAVNEKQPAPLAAEPPPPPPVAVGAAAPMAAADAAAYAVRAESSAKLMQSQSRIGFMPPRPAPMPGVAAEQREQYAAIASNPVQRAAENPVSTFSIDVDTGAYANVRRFLSQGQLPPRDAVRVEELVNYFDYRYPAPRDRNTPFSVSTELAPTPWNAKTHLLQIGVQGWKPQGERPAANLVFLIDVSGSMESPDKLPLVKASLKLLAQQLRPQDRLSLVVYAGRTAVVLEPTAGDQQAKIIAALDQLEAGGGTNGGAGIDLAYAMARQGYIKGGVNRVMLATDGDFNVGVTDFDQLLDRVKTQRKSGVALTTLGFGTGNYNEALMEQLADAGDGNYAYIDTLKEAQKVLVRQMDATLTTIARDVKIQVEFNPAQVAEYRLIGYENRALRREDFANDKVDAGDIGAGHTVTALFEVALVGEGGERIAPLRYAAAQGASAQSGELAHLQLRYKRPGDGNEAKSLLIERAIAAKDSSTLAASSDSFRLAAAVAGFGQLLRGGQYTQGFDYTAAIKLAQDARGRDEDGEAGEFLQLVQLARSLDAAALNTPVEDHGG